MIPTEITTWLLAQGPAGVIIFLLVTVIIYLFKRWDADREHLIEQGAEYAKMAVASANAIEIANANTKTLVEAVHTFKVLSELRLRERS